jgi:hypothetical protein
MRAKPKTGLIKCDKITTVVFIDKISYFSADLDKNKKITIKYMISKNLRLLITKIIF